MIGTPAEALTANPACKEATSLPVVSVTSRVPAIAAGSMFNRAEALVDEVTVSDATVIPAPKLAVVTPGEKWVNCPVMLIEVACP